MPPQVPAPTGEERSLQQTCGEWRLPREVEGGIHLPGTRQRGSYPQGKAAQWLTPTNCPGGVCYALDTLT